MAATFQLGIFFTVLSMTMMMDSAHARPCDIYAKYGTPCVAAHSTVRALFAQYQGPLYTVQRSSDNATRDIDVLAPGGIANAAAQDAFCSNGAICTVIRIYDQSSYKNHLGLAPPGGAAHHPDKGVDASRAPIRVGRDGTFKAYAAFFEGGMGYRIENTTGVARGDEPETLYMVTDGQHYNGGCCFDYGNAESNAKDTGAGSMEAVYFGNSSDWGKGGGAGPWIMADLENGLWAGDQKVNPGNLPIMAEFITAMVIGRSGNSFALKGGDATKGNLTVLYDGARPPGYSPMRKQGSIILGIGGDNSDWAVGTFYEGCITKGASTSEADDAVQADIVAAGYGRVKI